MASDRHRDFEAQVDRLAISLKRVLLSFAAQAIPMVTGREPAQPDLVLRSLGTIADRLGTLERIVTEVYEIIQGQRLEKEWYTTAELAEILGKSRFTIQERWCNDGRIECEKDPDSGKWRIPGHEVRRLRGGGGLLPRHRSG
jgi:hypothetical protein